MIKLAKYTTEVRSICEHYAGREEAGEFDDIDEIIGLARSHIFTVNYPIWENGSKSELETKILRHYYTREIGLETVGLWKHFLNTRMLEIMPYYVDYFNQSLNKLNIDGTVDLTKIINEEGSESGTNTGTRNIESTTDLDYGKNTTKTGNISTEDTTANTKSGSTALSGNDVNVRSGSERTTFNDTSTRTPNLTEKNKYSDTPQGTLTNVDQDNYLTDYRNISQTGTETTAKTGYDDLTYNNVTDTLTHGKTETYNNVKDQKSGTVTETFNSVKEQEGGSDTEEKNSLQTDDFANTGEHEYERTERITGIDNAYNLVMAKEKILNLLVNIDVMIISDLSDLFMRIY